VAEGIESRQESGKIAREELHAARMLAEPLAVKGVDLGMGGTVTSLQRSSDGGSNPWDAAESSGDDTLEDAVASRVFKGVQAGQDFGFGEIWLGIVHR
jgi:hypothetical protein